MNAWLSRFLLSGLVSIGCPVIVLANGSSMPPAASDKWLQSEASKAIISFVSPRALFPIEGFAFATAYRPLAVFDKPNGSPVGELTMTNADCSGAEDRTDCQQVGPWVLSLADGTRQSVEVGEYSYSGYGLVSYSQSIPAPAGAWSEISSEKGPVWVLTPADAVISYESLVHVVDNFDRWCDKLGSCRPIQDDMRTEMQRVADGEYKRATCYPEAYEIRSLTAADGVSYYEVHLAEPEPGSSSPRLPKSGFVPTRNLNGRHTGTFYPRGC